MMKKTINVRNSTLSRSLVIICSIALLTVLCAVSIYAAEFTYGIYFEIDKNPIESVEIVAMDKNGGEAPEELKRGAQVTLSALVYPLNARETVLSKKYKVIEGSDYATVKRGVLTVAEDAPIGSVIEVIAEVDDVASENSLVFTVARTPVEQITLLNTETSIMVGASLKLEAETFPADATDKNVRYSIVSNTPGMRMSYSGVLSFGSSTVPDDVIAVTVRASSASDPTVYVDKTFAVTRPIFETKDATAELSELNQKCAYSFNTRLPYLAEIFGNSAVNYSLDADESVATVDINGLLFVSEFAPIGTEIDLTITSADGSKTHCQRMIVAPVFATDFAPVMMGQPDIVFPEGDYYLPGSVIEFDVVAFAPINVTEENKTFAVRVSDDSLAYVEGNKVIIRNTAEISVRDPKLTVTVYSQPNGLEKDFEINIFIPVEGVTATAKKDQLVEKHSYALSDILGYTTTPANASVRSVIYGAEELDSSVGVIKNGVLIINDKLPDGVITVRLFAEIDGIRSDVAVFTVYKPAHNVTIEALVKDKPIVPDNDNVHSFPVSAINYSDTVTLITKVDGSVNKTNIVIEEGEEFIDGGIRFVRVEGGIAYFEFTLKKGLLNNGNINPVIKLCAVQEGVESDRAVIPIYVPREDVMIKDLTVLRGDIVQLVPIQNTAEDDVKIAVEYNLPDATKANGVTLLEDGYISVPRTIGGGTKFTVRYRAIEENGRQNEWKTVTCTVEYITESSVNIFKGGEFKPGFNIVYTKDDADVPIDVNKPQIMVGRYTDVNITYGSQGESVSAFGLRISADENGLISDDGPFYVHKIDNDTVRITPKDGAKGSAYGNIVITVVDGDMSREVEIGTFYVFRPISKGLTFGTVTANNQPITSVITDFDSNATYAPEQFKYTLTEQGISIQNGKIIITSLDIETTQKVEYRCEQYYNGKLYVDSNGNDEYVAVGTITIRSISINKDGGSGGRDKVIAVSDLANANVTCSEIIPVLEGHNFAGFGSYVTYDESSSVWKVVKDFYGQSELKASWSVISYKVTIVENNVNVTVIRTDRNTEVGDGALVPYGTGLKVTVTANSGYTNATVTNGGVTSMPASDITFKGSAEVKPSDEEGGKCVAKGTLITLADGTQKPVEELDGTEMLLVWDMFKGEFTAAPIMINISYAERDLLVTHLYFEDGNELDIIDEHGLFDATLNAFVFLTSENACEYIGHSFNMQYTDDSGKLCWKTVKLVDTKNETVYTAAYSPVTYGYLCCYVDGILSMPGETQGLCNYFTVDGETMKYDEAQMQADIELYGLFTYEEFADVIPPELFDAVNGQFVKVAVAKGLTTEEALMQLIILYAGFFDMEGEE